MALLNGFMPGEWDWQNPSMSQDYPTGGMLSSGGWQDRLNGALNGNNPLFNVGLGILANNNSKNLGTVLGNGITAGVQNTQRAQQLSQQKLLQDQQLKDYARKQQEYDRQQKALEAFKQKFPQYGEAVELDPKLAIKAAYPQLAQNSADPYYTPIPTASGLGSFNNRSGQFQLVMDANGQPVVKSADSPELQQKLSAAKSYGENLYQPTDMQPGVIKTKSQLAIDAGAPQLSQVAPQAQQPMQPQANVQGNFTGNPQAIISQINRISDPQERANAMAAFNQQYANPMPQQANTGGIRVRTPEEQAALTEQAKAQVEINKTSALNDQKQEQSASKGQRGLDAMMKYLYKDGVPTRDANGRLIPPKDIPILGNSIADRAAMMGHEYGLHNDKASNIIGARRLINSLVLDANNGSLGAGVSNADVQFLQKIQGVVDSAQDPKDVYNAIADNEERFNRILGIAKQQGTNTAAPVGVQRRRVFNPKTGRIE